MCGSRRAARSRDHKGVNLPRTGAPFADTSPQKDREDLEFGLKHGVDYVGVSFVRSAADLPGGAGGHQRVRSPTFRWIAKLERPEALGRPRRDPDATAGGDGGARRPRRGGAARGGARSPRRRSSGRRALAEDACDRGHPDAGVHGLSLVRRAPRSRTSPTPVLGRHGRGDAVAESATGRVPVEAVRDPRPDHPSGTEASRGHRPQTMDRPRRGEVSRSPRRSRTRPSFDRPESSRRARSWPSPSRATPRLSPRTGPPVPIVAFTPKRAGAAGG